MDKIGWILERVLRRRRTRRFLYVNENCYLLSSRKISSIKGVPIKVRRRKKKTKTRNKNVGNRLSSTISVLHPTKFSLQWFVFSGIFAAIFFETLFVVEVGGNCGGSLEAGNRRTRVQGGSRVTSKTCAIQKTRFHSGEEWKSWCIPLIPKDTSVSQIFLYSNLRGWFAIFSRRARVKVFMKNKMKRKNIPPFEKQVFVERGRIVNIDYDWCKVI